MKKYTIIVSRYQSVAVDVLADNIEIAEMIAEREVGEGGFFSDWDDVIEVVDSYDADEQDDEILPNFTQCEDDLEEFKQRNFL